MVIDGNTTLNNKTIIAATLEIQVFLGAEGGSSGSRAPGLKNYIVQLFPKLGDLEKLAGAEQAGVLK